MPLQFSLSSVSLVSPDLVTLHWDSPPLGFNLLLGNSKEIAVTQVNDNVGTPVTATGTVETVNQDPYQLVLTNVTGKFTRAQYPW